MADEGARLARARGEGRHRLREGAAGRGADACAEELGHPVDWDDLASYQDGLGSEGEEPSRPWTVGGVLAGTGCLVAALRFLAIWVNGLIALFD